MRAAFSQSIEALASDESILFITGDLGFNALEGVAQVFGERFINAGVAEQNMLGVAAALAREGFRPWVYSISPFIYARAFEQIRNDIAFHSLPVRLIGNGGGYGYGVMGPSHHALEDYGVLLTLGTYCDFRVLVPAFREDVATAIATINGMANPSYLRLGRCEKPPGVNVEPFSQWREVLQGDLGVVVCVGPLAGPLIGNFAKLPSSERPTIWTLGVLPINPDTLPSRLLRQIETTSKVVFAEEHGAHGGAGDKFLFSLYQAGLRPQYSYHYAKGYISGRYGSQNYHRVESALDSDSIMKSLRS